MEPLIELAQKIKDPTLQEKVISFLNSPQISIETFGEELSIEEAPASKSVHHSYKGGLIDHTVAVTLFALEIAQLLHKVYQIDFINEDLIIAGGILHDIYKPLTYTQIGEKYERSRLGSKIDHTSLIFAEAWHRKFPLELLHIILAHHGKGSPAQPRSLEALILHLADYVDSEFINNILFGAQNIANRAGKKIKIDNYKFAAMVCNIMTHEGIDGVKKYLESY